MKVNLDTFADVLNVANDYGFSGLVHSSIRLAIFTDYIPVLVLFGLGMLLDNLVVLSISVGWFLGCVFYYMLMLHVCVGLFNSTLKELETVFVTDDLDLCFTSEEGKSVLANAAVGMLRLKGSVDSDDLLNHIHPFGDKVFYSDIRKLDFVVTSAGKRYMRRSK